ncbi:Bet v I/Major latex protein [Arabidopsis suecica]|uniref:Bet v I/Major latex protein n=1 Tax=Arabidopsis suecica TaxID=45249 RepID=A0A8T2CMN9_ARASU|nr:Bet v I/Major latex protein [Arabidopsis suecica]
MALDGVLTRDFDVESPVDKFFKAFLEISNLPVEDNATAVVTMDDGDLEKRKVKIKISSVDISKCYKKLEGIITVTPMNKGGSHVIWSVEYEKTRPEIEDPHSIIDTSIKYFQGIDAILVKERDEKIVKEMSEELFKFIRRSIIKSNKVLG